MAETRDWIEARHLTLATVNNRLKGQCPSLRLTPIDRVALSEARAWPLVDRQVTWDWTGVVKRRESGRIEVAIWSDDHLCGLAYGPMRGGALCISRLEGAPGSVHPLKGRMTDIAIAVLETQALIFGIPETRLESPDPALVARYRQYGYAWLANNGDARYLVKVRAFR